MRRYRIESLDPRDDSIINIDSVNADLFVVDEEHKTVTFFVENPDTNGSMTPVAMFPFIYVLSILPDFTTEEGDSK